MNNYLHSPRPRQFLALVLSALLLLSQNVFAADPVRLATSPLATSSNSSVFPNLMFMLDDSGSMDWDYMPDDAKDFNGKYGFYSSQCNGVYYNPAITYLPPVTSTGISYPNASFTAAWENGYDTVAGTTNLSTSFKGGSGSGSSGSTLSSTAAFYYLYTGTLTNSSDKDYLDNSSPFYSECNTGTAPGVGNSKFTRVIVSAISGPGLTDERTNFANWYSYYSNRMLMMKTGVGIAFKALNSRIRLGYMTMNNNNSNDFVDIAPFDPTQKSSWYSKLYDANPGNRTPLRQALSQVGHLYANKFGPVTTYTATIKVNGNNSTTVSSVRVGPVGGPYVDLLDATTNSSNKSSNVARNIASEINTLDPSLYSATANNSTVTITGPAVALGYEVLVTDNGGGMTFTTSDFVATTVTGKLNGVVPNDPIQYSCQKNFVILSTDGYWNNNAGYKLDGTAIGNQDATAPRPMYDGSLLDKVSSNITQTISQVKQETSTLQGTLSKVLMQCNNTAALCGSAPSTGVANASWSVVTGTNGTCVATSSVQCAIVSGLGGTTAVVSACKTSASISSITSSGKPNNTISAYMSNNSHKMALGLSSTDPDPSNNHCYELGGTGANTAWFCRGSGNNKPKVSSSSVTDSTGKTWYLVDDVSGNTDCVTNKTAWGGSYSSSRGACPSVPAGTTYTLNNADSNGNIYSSCAYTAWSTPTLVSSCTSISQGSPNNTNVVLASNCTTTTSTPTLVASCTPGNSGSPDYFQTNCNTSNVVDNNVSSCIPESPSSSNNYTTVTCTGGGGGTSDTLADTAMFYYETDLRDSSLSNCTGALGDDVCNNNVPVSGIDTNDKQHLTTFSLGLGARGRMAFSSTYLDDTSGDFYDVKKGTVASGSICSWQNGGPCNWPTPSDGAVENIDDLWHAAINGRGTYFNASDPTSLATGLSQTLKSIDQVTGAAAAAATSTLNPTATDNFAYVASYTTEKWSGNLEQRTIDINTGVVSKSADWCIEDVSPSTCAYPDYVVTDTSGPSPVKYCASTAVDQNADTILDNADCASPRVFDSGTATCRVQIQNICDGSLSGRVSSGSDTRTIYTASGGALTPFDETYVAANPTYFSSPHIDGLSQWATLTPAQQTAAQGDNLINYLRGRHGYEENRTSNPAADWLYRYRDAVLGDALESQPTFIGHPTFSYADPGYGDFVTANASRASTVYIGTNDGMLHAFAGLDGSERWAYVPSVVIPNMWKLADVNYSSQHVNFVNGPPVISDICTANCTNTAYATTVPTADDPVWKTILVGGLNAGGRAFYALDVTDPVAPSLLWEFTSADSANLGYSFSKPVVTKLANSHPLVVAGTLPENTWVVLVTSGYDNGTLSADNATPNSPAGDGKGHLFVLNAQTGAIISDIVTTAGTAAAPSGLAKINAYNEINGNNQAGYVYGGDLEGNLWRFDINDPATAATGTGAVTKFAILQDSSGTVQPITIAPTLGKVYGERVIFIGTGKYLEIDDLTDTQVQTLYAIKDNDSATLVNPRTSLVQQSIITGSSTRTGSGNAVDFRTGRGWFIDLPDTGERVNIDFKLVQGTLLAPTIVPSVSACSPGGYGWLNYLDYKTGTSVDTNLLVSQRYDSPIVGMNVIYIKGQPIVEVVTSSNPTPEKPASDVPFQASSGSFLKSREVWRELIP